MRAPYSRRTSPGEREGGVGGREGGPCKFQMVSFDALTFLDFLSHLLYPTIDSLSHSTLPPWTYIHPHRPFVTSVLPL